MHCSSECPPHRTPPTAAAPPDPRAPPGCQTAWPALPPSRGRDRRCPRIAPRPLPATPPAEPPPRTPPPVSRTSDRVPCVLRAFAHPHLIPAKSHLDILPPHHRLRPSKISNHRT